MKKPTKLSVVMLHPTHRSYLPSVLIEGDKTSLQYLAKLILKVANDDDCGRGFDGRSALFTSFTEMGLYFHRLPCVHGELGGPEKSAQQVAAANIQRGKRQLSRAKQRPTPRKRASPES